MLPSSGQAATTQKTSVVSKTAVFQPIRKTLRLSICFLCCIHTHTNTCWHIALFPIWFRLERSEYLSSNKYDTLIARYENRRLGLKSLKNIARITLKSYQGRYTMSERTDERKRQRYKLKCATEIFNRFTNENKLNPADMLVCYCRGRIQDARSCDNRICIKKSQIGLRFRVRALI